MDNEKSNIFSGFVKYLYYLVFDFINSFRYNNMKLSAILVAVPGILIGFFLNSHANTILNMSFITTQYQHNVLLNGTIEHKTVSINAPGMPFDYTGVVIFFLMLFGILNIFCALGLSGKKNLGSVITSTIITSLMVVLTVLYLYAIFYFIRITTEGDNIIPSLTLIEVAPQKYVIDYSQVYEQLLDGTWVLSDKDVYQNKVFEMNNLTPFYDNYLTSIISICVSDILSIVGCVLGFIFYDRTYEKVDR